MQTNSKDLSAVSMSAVELPAPAKLIEMLLSLGGVSPAPSSTTGETARPKNNNSNTTKKKQQRNQRRQQEEEEDQEMEEAETEEAEADREEKGASALYALLTAPQQYLPDTLDSSLFPTLSRLHIGE